MPSIIPHLTFKALFSYWTFARRTTGFLWPSVAFFTKRVRMEYHFVETDSKSLAVRSRVNAAAIRSHAMKEVRRKQREELFAGINEI